MNFRLELQWFFVELCNDGGKRRGSRFALIYFPFAKRRILRFSFSLSGERVTRDEAIDEFISRVASLTPARVTDDASHSEEKYRSLVLDVNSTIFYRLASKSKFSFLRNLQWRMSSFFFIM